MIHTAIALIALSTTCDTQSVESSIKLSTLGGILNAVAVKSGYRASLPDELARRPVVYYFQPDLDMSTTIKGISYCLSLNVNVDSQKKILSITYQPEEGVLTKQDRIARSYDNIRNILGTYIRKSPQERQGYIENMKAVAVTQQDTYAAEEYYRMIKLLSNLDSAKYRKILPMSILETLPWAASNIFITPYTYKNSLKLSPSCLSMLNSCLVAQDNNRLDFENPSHFVTFWNTLSNQDQQFLRNEITQNQNQCMFDIHHDTKQDSVDLELRAITLYRQIPIHKLELRLKPPIVSSIPSQDSFAGDSEIFEMKMPFDSSSSYTINSFGCAANKLNCNYIGWLYDSALRKGSSSLCKLNAIQSYRYEGSGANLEYARVARKGQWLRIVDYLDPKPEYSADWQYLVEIKNRLDADLMTLGELRTYLNKLSDTALDNLELVQADYPSISDKYHGVTRGVRVLRALLNSNSDIARSAGKSLSIPVAAMPDVSKQDMYKLVQSSYFRSVYPQMSLANNKRRISDIVINACIVSKQSQKYLNVEVKFPAVLTLGIECLYYRDNIQDHGLFYSFQLPIESN